MPVPVHHTVGPGRKMAVSTKPKLSLIRRPAWKSLRFRLQHQIIIMLQTTDHIPTKSNLRTGQLILGGMINIGSGNGQSLRNMQMVHIRLHSVRITSPLKIHIVSNKLVFSLILTDDPGLPA